jgi:hypothetical protein
MAATQTKPATTAEKPAEKEVDPRDNVKIGDIVYFYNKNDRHGEIPTPAIVHRVMGNRLLQLHVLKREAMQSVVHFVDGARHADDPGYKEFPKWSTNIPSWKHPSEV